MPSSSVENPSHRSRDRVVLVVDDEKMMRLLARQSLEGYGFTVIEAHDGNAALDCFHDRHPDLVLLDVQMPGKDGFQVCREIRDSPFGRFTPIMMMTGLDDVASIERSYEAGATDFINKPLNWLVLGHRLEYILRSSRSSERLRDSEAKLSNAQRIAKLGYWEWIPDQDRLYCSSELRRIFGIPAGHRPTNLEELTMFIHSEQRPRFRDTIRELLAGEASSGDLEFKVHTGAGGERFVRQYAETLLDDDGSVTRVSGTIQDVTEQREAEEKLRYMAYYDALTGLPNRRSFTENLERILQDPRHRDVSTAVLFIDLNRLDVVNESLGRTGRRRARSAGGAAPGRQRSRHRSGRARHPQPPRAPGLALRR